MSNARTDRIEATVNKVNEERDDLEQYTRKYNLEFIGIPDTEDRADSTMSLEESIKCIANNINVDLSDTDIDIVHRFGRFRSGVPKPVIVRFSNYKAKQHLFQAKKRLKDSDLSTIFGFNPKIYINENLTARRRKLFGEARALQKANRWNRVWTNDGKIFIKKSPEQPSKQIRNSEELKKRIS